MKTMLENEVLGRYKNVIGVPRGSERGILRDHLPAYTVQTVSGEIGYVVEMSPSIAFVVLDSLFGTFIPKESVVRSFNRVAANVSMYDKSLREDILMRFLEYCFSEHVPHLAA